MDLAEVPIAVLAGGQAKRLGSATAHVPKALIELAGRPFIDHQLRLLHRQGFRRLVLCVGHLGEQIERYVGDGATHGLEVRYSRDGDRLLGTGGALRQAGPLLGEVFWATYGDTLLDLDYRGLLAEFLQGDALGLMTVLRNENRWDQSNVLFRDGKLLRYDKGSPTPDMRHIDYGATLLRRRALERIPADRPSDLAELYRTLVSEGSLAGAEVTRRFYEIGSPAGLAETRAFLEAERARDEPEGASTKLMSYTTDYLAEVREIGARLDPVAIDRLVEFLVALRQRGGRLFVLGVGGSAANASHAVSDFRKIAGIEAYTPVDNVSELTARVNDEGWEGVFAEWLSGSRLRTDDAVLVLSVGGGDLERNISANLVHALRYAKRVGAGICGIVGRDGGYTARVADACVVIPTVNPEKVTPHTEAFQAVIWHLVVSHPRLRLTEMKWESLR